MSIRKPLHAPNEDGKNEDAKDSSSRTRVVSTGNSALLSVILGSVCSFSMLVFWTCYRCPRDRPINRISTDARTKAKPQGHVYAQT